jgi:hypothetical protein
MEIFPQPCRYLRVLIFDLLFFGLVTVPYEYRSSDIGNAENGGRSIEGGASPDFGKLRTVTGGLLK